MHYIISYDIPDDRRRVNLAKVLRAELVLPTLKRRVLPKMNVYGTLKRGCWNHDRFCRGVLDVQEAVVRGRLYELSSGIHVQQVPGEDILAHGTADPLADLSACYAQAGVATQARLSDRVGFIPQSNTGEHHSGRLGPRVRGTAHL